VLLATVHSLGRQRCNGDVPSNEPDLMQDRLCRACADDCNAALAARRTEAAERRKVTGRLRLAA
jgi:hypothetical protein